MKNIVLTSAALIIILFTTGCTSKVHSSSKIAEAGIGSNIDSISKPALKERLIAPPYPYMAVRSKMEGVTELNLFLNSEGKVKKALVVKSSGYSLLDEAAANWAVDKWSFKPCMRGAEPVECWYTLIYTWKIVK